MSPAQAKLLRELIEAERAHAAAVLEHTRREGEGWAYPQPGLRWVEVSGPTVRTAYALADAGLVDLEGRAEGRQLWARLAIG